MKKPFVLLVLSLAVVAVSCQNQTNEYGDDMLKKFAQNASYKAYLASQRSIQLGIARHDFDMPKIASVIIRNPNKEVCDIPKEDFIGIFGGPQYQELFCDFFNKSKQLDSSLPGFSKLTSDQVIRVSQIHDEHEGINWTQTVRNAILTRN